MKVNIVQSIVLFYIIENIFVYIITMSLFLFELISFGLLGLILIGNFGITFIILIIAILIFDKNNNDVGRSKKKYLKVKNE